jgi:16S rRNA (guanine527-N7)-methyltransferase
MSLITDAQTLFNLSLTPAQAAQMDVLAQELIAWNAEKMNLTAITDPAQVQTRHLLDSLSLAKVVTFTAGMKIMDVGTGAGFPGVPLAIAFPQVRVTLMEATAKKLTFIEHITQTLGLTNTKTLHARAEDAGQNPRYRAAFEVVTARAVARLPALLEYLLPLTKEGGLCIAMKGSTAAEEAQDAQAALQALGGELRDITAIELPAVEEAHYLVVVAKTRKTPALYPRKAGLPTKKPLGSE